MCVTVCKYNKLATHTVQHRQAILDLLPLIDSVYNWILTFVSVMLSLSTWSVAGWHVFLHDHCLHYLISLSLSASLCVCLCVCVYSVLYTILLASAKDSFNCFLASTLRMCNERNASVYSSFLQLTTQTDLMFCFAATIPRKKENSRSRNVCYSKWLHHKKTVTLHWGFCIVCISS